MLNVTFNKVMKKSVLMGFSFMEGVDPNTVVIDARQIEIDPDFQSSGKSPVDSLIKLIYKIDENTKLPTGDLSYFVSDKANPEIKKFILDNLMMDVSSVSRPAIPAGLSDDLAFEFERKEGESLDAYAARLNTEIEKAKWLNDEYKKSAVSSDKVSE